ncbi:MAG: VapC toxin family domain ribonuclease [Caulobacter sp.]|nr:VapC toxin family domain ribonuclease [Caulobacter sp.]
MSFILDTNVAIHLRDDDTATKAKVRQLDGAIMFSIITRVELEGGIAANPAKAALRRPRLDAMLRAIPTVDFDATSADTYRSMVEVAGFSRRKILDRMIAAQAITLRATLVTMNPGDFADIPGLKLLAW